MKYSHPFWTWSFEKKISNWSVIFFCSYISLSWSNRLQKFFKIGILKNFEVFTGKHMYWSLFLIKLQSPGLERYSKETPIHVLSGEYWGMFKNQLHWIPLVGLFETSRKSPVAEANKLITNNNLWYEQQQPTKIRRQKSSNIICNLSGAGTTKYIMEPGPSNTSWSWGMRPGTSGWRPQPMARGQEIKIPFHITAFTHLRIWMAII